MAQEEDQQLKEKLRRQLRENGILYEEAEDEEDFAKMAGQFAGVAFIFGGLFRGVGKKASHRHSPVSAHIKVASRWRLSRRFRS